MSLSTRSTHPLNISRDDDFHYPGLFWPLMTLNLLHVGAKCSEATVLPWVLLLNDFSCDNLVDLGITSNISKPFSSEGIMIPVHTLMDFQFEHSPGKLERELCVWLRYWEPAISNTEQAPLAAVSLTTHQASFCFTIIAHKLHEEIICLVFFFFFPCQLSSSQGWFCRCLCTVHVYSSSFYSKSRYHLFRLLCPFASAVTAIEDGDTGQDSQHVSIKLLQIIRNPTYGP